MDKGGLTLQPEKAESSNRVCKAKREPDSHETAPKTEELIYILYPWGDVQGKNRISQRSWKPRYLPCPNSHSWVTTPPDPNRRREASIWAQNRRRLGETRAKLHMDHTLNAKTINFLPRTWPVILHTPPGKRPEESSAQEEKPREWRQWFPKEAVPFLHPQPAVTTSCIHVHRASRQLSVLISYVEPEPDPTFQERNMKRRNWDKQKKHKVYRRQYQQSIINVFKEIKENTDIGLTNTFLGFVWFGESFIELQDKSE